MIDKPFISSEVGRRRDKAGAVARSGRQKLCARARFFIGSAAFIIFASMPLGFFMLGASLIKITIYAILYVKELYLQGAISMNALSIRQKQIIDFGNSVEFKELDAYYSQPSIFSALGVSRHENTHSNFLAWLLTPKPEKNDHGLGDMPLRKFLETLALACTLPHSAGKLAPELSGTIATGAYRLSSITVERERHIGVGRLDIYLAGNIAFDGSEYPLTLIIENKVKSSEHDSQTGRYLEALRSPASRPGIFLSVFLTPLPNREYERLDAPTCGAKEFIELNYQYLADYVIEPCCNSAPNGNIKRYLGEYLLALGLPETRQDKGEIIMAISKEERDLLARFWNKHKDLLTAVLLSMGDCVPLEDDESELLQKASKVIKTTIQHDLSRFSWEFLGEGGINLPKSRLVLEIVTHYAKKKAPITLRELKKVFPDSLLPGKLCVVETLTAADKSNFKGRKRYYTDEAVVLSDGPVAVCTQWRADNILNFIDCAEKLGYSISSTGPTC